MTTFLFIFWVAGFNFLRLKCCIGYHFRALNTHIYDLPNYNKKINKNKMGSWVGLPNTNHDE